jgi:integrase
MPWVSRVPSDRCRCEKCCAATGRPVEGATRTHTATWQGGYRNAEGRKRTQVWPTKAAALSWAGDRESEVRKGDHRDPRAGHRLLRDWWGQWWPTAILADRTREKHLTYWHRYTEPRWAGSYMDGIDKLGIAGWVAELDRAGVSPHAVHGAHAILHRALHAAVDYRVLGSNPATGVKLPTIPPSVERFLTRAEAESLIARFAEPWRTAVMLMLFCGLRWEELAGLRKHRVDLARRKLYVVGITDRHGNDREYPKGRLKRHVPLTPRAAAGLEPILDRTPPKGRVFPAHQGGPVLYGNFLHRIWTPALVTEWTCAVEGCRGTAGRLRAGCAGHDPISRGTPRHKQEALAWLLRDPLPSPHDLRHTYGSWLADAGIPVDVIQRRMGHTDVRTTMRYIHEAHNADERVIAALAAGDPVTHPDLLALDAELRDLGADVEVDGQ